MDALKHWSILKYFQLLSSAKFNSDLESLMLTVCEYACYLSICVHIWVTWDKFSRQGNCLFGLGGQDKHQWTPPLTPRHCQQCALNTRAHVHLLRTRKGGHRETQGKIGQQKIRSWLSGQGNMTWNCEKVTSSFAPDLPDGQKWCWYSRF